jgi:PKD repeat protein
MKQRLNTLKNIIKMVFSISAIIFVVSCEEAFEFDLPEAGSIPDLILPQANFSTAPDPENFRKIKFTNTSNEATNYLWDFGGGDTSTEKDPIYTFVAGEGDYEVTLTALDANDALGTSTQIIEVRDVFVPINPNVINGDFENKTFSTNWGQIDTSGFSSTTPNTSSDGSWLKYDGTDNGSKTGGMKFSSSASNLGNPGSRRFAYQPVKVSETTVDRTVKYIVEFEYSLKTGGLGSYINVQILDGYFDTVANALASTPLMESINDDSEQIGHTAFTTVKKEFTSNASGEVAIFIFASTTVDAYIDNVKIYPKP